MLRVLRLQQPANIFWLAAFLGHLAQLPGNRGAKAVRPISGNWYNSRSTSKGLAFKCKPELETVERNQITATKALMDPRTDKEIKTLFEPKMETPMGRWGIV